MRLNFWTVVSILAWLILIVLLVIPLSSVLQSSMQDAAGNFSLATYDTGDTFDQSLAKGFIELWSLPSKISERRDAK